MLYDYCLHRLYTTWLFPMNVSTTSLMSLPVHSAEKQNRIQSAMEIHRLLIVALTNIFLLYYSHYNCWGDCYNIISLSSEKMRSQWWMAHCSPPTSAISITVGVASMADCVNVLYDVELLSENGTYMSSS